MKRSSMLLLIALLLAACGPAATPPVAEEPTMAEQSTPTGEPASNRPAPEGELIRVDLPRIEAPEVAEEQVAELVAGNNAFAFDLYHAVAEQEDGNLIASPYSISLAFSMIYAGAHGETQAQMAEVLNYLPQAAQHPAFNVLDRRLSSLGQGVEQGEGETGDPFQLNIANSVWGQQGFPFEQPFLEILARQYGAGLRVTDFQQAPDAAREVVNAWVAGQTEDRIRDILPQGSVTPNTRMILANAIYFKASWLFRFEESATQDGAFTLVDGSTVTVPLMHQTARLSYTAGDDYQAVELPYVGSSVSMVLILPEAGRFEEIEERLNPDFLEEVRTRNDTRDVVLTMPRFEFELGLSLPDILSTMDMPALFQGGQADLSGMSAGGGLFVSDAFHKAFIKVDEEGTEAAAATVAEIAESAVERAEMAIDRPFIFAIVERETGAILFQGRVLNPAP